MSSHCDTCSFKCYGIDGYDGSCCHVEGRDWIMGPINDWDVFLDDLSKKLGREVEFKEVFFNFEEGSKLFPDRSVWQLPGNFPAFKVDMEKIRKPCVMYNTATRSCSVYDIRPETCRNYYCDYLSKVFEQ